MVLLSFKGRGKCLYWLLPIFAKHVDLNMSKKNRFMVERDESKKFLVADVTKKTEKNKEEKDVYDYVLD